MDRNSLLNAVTVLLKIMGVCMIEKGFEKDTSPLPNRNHISTPRLEWGVEERNGGR